MFRTILDSLEHRIRGKIIRGKTEQIAQTLIIIIINIIIINIIIIIIIIMQNLDSTLCTFILKYGTIQIVYKLMNIFEQYIKIQNK